MASPLVIPSRIPWGDLRAKELEEAVYWLLDSMGAKDLEWRIGGRGQGSADGGRDLAAAFHVPAPDGEMLRQLWWVECKGRSGTLEATAVKEAVINASGVSEVDFLVVVTNTTFTNPTTDWVKEWQRTHSRPIVRLWDQHALERMASRHPSMAVRLFPSALSDQGRLEVVRSEFWNHGAIAGNGQLRALWRARTELAISPESLLALLCSEAATKGNGDRGWALLADDDTLANSLAFGIANAAYLLYRTDRMGVSFDFFVEAMGQVLLVILTRVPAALVADLIEQVWQGDHRFASAPAAVRNVSVEAMVDLLEAQIHDVCTSDCRRVSTSRFRLSAEEARDYWDRLKPPHDEPDEHEQPTRVLFIEFHDQPCKAGFSVGTDHGCPLQGEEGAPLGRRLALLQQVIRARNPHPT